jgi:hypothetical protein
MTQLTKLKKTDARRTASGRAFVVMLLIIGTAVAVPALTRDSAPPAQDLLPRVAGLGISVAVPSGWEDTAAPADELIEIQDQLPADATDETHLYLNAFRVNRLWDPDASRFVEPTSDAGFETWLRGNPAFAIEERADVSVAGQSTGTLTIRLADPAGAPEPLAESTAALDPATAAEFADATGQPVIVGPGETHLLTPITVDGATVILYTFTWPDGVYSGSITPERQIADYRTWLQSARLEPQQMQTTLSPIEGGLRSSAAS